MRNYLINITIVTFLYLALVWILAIITPYYWAKPRVAAKYAHFIKNSAEYNTIFFGSSKVNCNLMPTVFDSLMPVGSRYKSFNLAESGTTFPENYYLLKNTLPLLSDNVKVIFFQATRPRRLSDESLDFVEDRYFLDFDVSRRLSSYYQSERMNYVIWKKAFYRLMRVGERLRRFSFKREMKRMLSEIVPFEESFGHLDTRVEKDEWIQVSKNKRSNIHFHDKLKLQLEGHRTKAGRPYSPPEEFVSWIEEIDRLCSERGIRCIFFSVPNEAFTFPDHIDYMYMGDGGDNPSLFKFEDHMDHVHLWPSGARRYTEVFSRQYIMTGNYRPILH